MNPPECLKKDTELWSIDETNEVIAYLIAEDKKPPKEFLQMVLNEQIRINDTNMNALVEKGWLPRTRCEVWSRVMGYYRPVKEWNKGKREEYKERYMLTMEDLKDANKSSRP